MTIELRHKNSGYMVRISNDRYMNTGEICVTGDGFLVEHFNAYFNKQLTDEWGMGTGIPDEFKKDGKLLKNSDTFLLSYFIPLYQDIYEIQFDEIKD